MKHIYVIGNGFDIDLGWRTSYKDFYNSKIECWRRSYFKDDELMYYVMEHAGENWYDLEKTLYDYCLDKSKSGFVTQDNAEKDFRHYESLKNQVINYVQSQSQKPVIETSKAYEILKSYIEKSSRTHLPDDKRPELISFNYTPLDIVAKQIAPKAVFKYIPVHGTLEKNNCIFGFHDDTRIKGTYRDIQKSLDDNYMPGTITPLLMDAGSITFFGLSMGFIDKVYYEALFKKISQPADSLTRKKMDIEFITRDKQSKKDIKKNLQDIGIDFQALSTNNNVIFTLTSENK